MSFLTVRPSVHVKDVGDGRRFPGVLFFSLFRVLLQFLFFTVYIYCYVVLITVAGTAGGGDAAASALFFCPTYCIILIVWYVIYFYVAVAAEDQHAMLKVN